MPHSHPTLMFIFGTRPETIKLTPVIEQAFAHGFPTMVLPVSQHSDLLQLSLEALASKVRVLQIQRSPSGSMPEFLSQALPLIHAQIIEQAPDWVVVHGDTLTSLAGAQAAFLAKVKIAHVEAGLRTNDTGHPYPEEGIRQMIGRITDLHFAPTKRAAANLEKENVGGEILITGNTIVDAVKTEIASRGTPKKQFLVSIHRREKSDAEIEAVISTVRRIAEKHLDWKAIWLCHPADRIRQPVVKGLRNISNVVVAPPLRFKEHLQLLKEAAFVVTDSGGVTEEAGILGVPTIICRDCTERMESIDCGNAVLLPADAKILEAGIDLLIKDELLRKRRSVIVAEYGDGNASKRILAAIQTRQASDLLASDKAA